MMENTAEKKDDQNSHANAISDELKDRLKAEPDAIGVDIDGTNPGSNAHPLDSDEKND